MTLVTFIIPTIGRDSLQMAINSLYQQTIWDWKAIIIFDGIEQPSGYTEPILHEKRLEYKKINN